VHAVIEDVLAFFALVKVALKANQMSRVWRWLIVANDAAPSMGNDGSNFNHAVAVVAHRWLCWLLWLQLLMHLRRHQMMREQARPLIAPASVPAGSCAAISACLFIIGLVAIGFVAITSFRFRVPRRPAMAAAGAARSWWLRRWSWRRTAADKSR